MAMKYRTKVYFGVMKFFPNDIKSQFSEYINKLSNLNAIFHTHFEQFIVNFILTRWSIDSQWNENENLF